MRKILTFVVMLSCTLIASANWDMNIQKGLQKQFKPLESNVKVQPVKQHFGKNIPTDIQLPANENFRLPAAEKPVQNKARKAAMAAITATADSAEAAYLGEYLYQYYQQWYGDIWEVTVWDTNNNEWKIQFVGPSATRIAGEYTDAYLTYVAGTDTITAEGDFTIEFVATVSDNPTYKFSGTFTDDNSNTYTLNENPTAYTFPEGWAYDYLYYVYCEYGYTAACSYVDIELQDKEVTPTGDTLDVYILGEGNMTQYEGGFYVGSRDADTYFYTFLNTESESPVGHYEAEDIDLTNTTLYWLSPDTLLEEIYQGISADVTETETTYHFIVRVLDMNGLQYNMIFDYAKFIVSDTIKTTVSGVLYDYMSDYGLILSQAFNDSILFSNAVSADSLGGEFTDADAYYYGYYDYLIKYDATDTITYIPDNYHFTLTEGSGLLAGYYLVKMYYNVYNQEDKTDAHCFEITALLTTPYAYDQDKDTSYTFTANLEDVIFTDYFATDSVVMVGAWSADSTVFFYGEFVLNSLDPTIIIPADEYDIDDSEEAPSMVASSGFNGKYNNPSYLTTFSGEYQYIWYIVDGTATMTADSLVVNGFNSNGNSVTVTINFGSEPTGLKQVAESVKVSKFMHDGNIYLMKDNQMYNLLGGRVK